MPAHPLNEIRADYDKSTIVVYQAYRPQIADAAIAAGRFVPPFSFGRMTWIKPSFLWLMERSNWGQKSGQERTLAVRITRAGWAAALSAGVMSQHDPAIYRGYDDWRQRFDAAAVHIQWDPERSLRGATLAYNAIQVGVSRHLIQTYVDEWIVAIEDRTPLVRKIYDLVQSGHEKKAKGLLPKERLYPLSPTLSRQIGMTRRRSWEALGSSGMPRRANELYRFRRNASRTAASSLPPRPSSSSPRRRSPRWGGAHGRTRSSSSMQ